MIEHVLQREQPGRIRFRLFDRAVEFLQLLARRGRLAIDRDLVRTQPVAQFVRQYVSKKQVKIDVALLVSGQHALRDGNQRALELCLLHILQHDALAAFFRDDPLVVGKVVGSGLHSVIAVSGADHFVYDADGGLGADLGIAILCVERQVVLDLLKVLGERSQLGAFRVVTDIDVRFIRGLIAKQFVVVGLVRTNGDVERGVKVHPRDVAFVIVIGQEGSGAGAEEPFQCRVIRERGRFLQQTRSSAAGRLCKPHCRE